MFNHLRPSFFICFLLFFTLFACRSQDASWERVQEAGVLRVGLDPTYPPFEVADGVGVQGIDVDLAEAIAAELGVTVDFVYFGYDGLYDALGTGQVDVLISAMVIVPQQTRDFAYSLPYYDAGESLIVPVAAPIEEMADVGDGIVAVELGAQGHVVATEWQRRLPAMQVQPYDTAEEAVTAVATGEATAALVDSISGRLALQARLALAAQPELHFVEPSIRPEPFVMVVRVADEALLAQLNHALITVQESGQWQMIMENWLGS